MTTNPYLDLSRQLVTLGEQNVKEKRELTDALTGVKTEVNNFAINFKNQFIQQTQTYNLLNNRVTSLETQSSTDRNGQTLINNNQKITNDNQNNLIKNLTTQILQLEKQHIEKDEEIRKLKTNAPVSKETVDRMQVQIDKLVSYTYALSLSKNNIDRPIGRSNYSKAAQRSIEQTMTMELLAIQHFNK